MSTTMPDQASSTATASSDLRGNVMLITGAARRIGAATATRLHSAGARVVIHYRHSSAEADALCARLNAQRTDSAKAVSADLNDHAAVDHLAQQALEQFGQIDALVNNASSFYPTPIGSATGQQWDDLMASNLRAPFFLAQALAPELAKRHGTIINLIDIHASRPLKDHTIYCAAKAGLVMVTQSLARELAPAIRVNGIAPGPILWPENDLDEATKASILNGTPLKRHGDPDDIARTILFLVRDAEFITGQIIAVDGGRSLRG